MDTTEDTIELDEHPELTALAERVARTGKPCRITQHGKDIARLIATSSETTAPVDIRGPDWRPDPTGLERAAGGWKNVDVDRFLRDIYASRDASGNRPLPQ